jgi:hypothetical protein
VRVNFPVEGRFVRGDDGRLSPAHGYADEVDVDRTFAGFWRALAPLGARPHWGKELDHDAAALRPLYPAWARFTALREELDPARVSPAAFTSSCWGKIEGHMVRDSQRLEHAIAMWLDTVAAEDLADTQIRIPSIVPPPDDRAGRDAIALLGELHRGGARLRTIETIGQGGMGVVRLAEQVALGRRVAVKTLRPDRKSDQAAIDLLREAWVTGAVDHPNVVPVHDIGLDEDGSPVIVLKRIDGHSWAELMHDADRVRERFRVDDLLTWNLEILIQVLFALRFAHSRGIVHRDLKPDNVMIGDFGEVYLLDWGIALSLRDDPRPATWRPRCSAATTRRRSPRRPTSTWRARSSTRF